MPQNWNPAGFSFPQPGHVTIARVYGHAGQEQVGTGVIRHALCTDLRIRADVGGPPETEVDEHLEIGPFSITLRRPADAEGLIDEERFDDDEFLPYWAELWPSGLALARHVAVRALAGRTVLELGCGLGLPSLAAALAGADVLATDWAPEALGLLRHNAASNELIVATAVLAWGGDDALDLGQFDLVLAADVLYEARNARPLLRLLDRVVASGGEALIADPGRRHAAAFFDVARAEGWFVEVSAVADLPAGGITRLHKR